MCEKQANLVDKTVTNVGKSVASNLRKWAKTGDISSCILRHKPRLISLMLGSADTMSKQHRERGRQKERERKTYWLIVQSEQRVTVGQKAPGTFCKPQI